MKVVSLAGLIVVALVLLSLVLASAGRIELSEARLFEYIITLLLLDASQDAAQRGDEPLSAFASIASVVVAALTLF